MSIVREIEIVSEGELLSRVISGENVAGVVPYMTGYPSVFIVSDEATACYTAEVVAAIREAGIGESLRGVKEMRATESCKNMDTVIELCRWLLEEKADRNSLLLAIGGGITSDTAGFAASIYKRGMDFAFIPTTLLSQVDAAIGGKTGVNFLGYKNMLGVIRQPVFTYECPEVLATLPYRDFVSGTAEMLKSFIIHDDGGNYDTAVSTLAAIFKAGDRAAAINEQGEKLLSLIHAAASVKAGVVSRDQMEGGERRVLNLGHTFAHGIEWEANSSGNAGIAHGEAVAMGMILAARLSEKTGISGAGLTDRLASDFKACGLPVECPFPLADMAEAIKRDKKAGGGTMHFVLIERIGHVVLKSLSVEEAIRILDGRE